MFLCELRQMKQKLSEGFPWGMGEGGSQTICGNFRNSKKKNGVIHRRTLHLESVKPKLFSGPSW